MAEQKHGRDPWTVLRFRRFLRREEGAAIVEFALVLPLLLLLVLGMIDFGKALNYWIDQTHLANEGSRWAAVNSNPGSGAGLNLQQYIRNQVETGEQHGDVQGTQQTAHAATVNICFYRASDGSLESTGAVGDTVEVTVKYAYDWMPYLRWKANLGPTSTIAGKAAMRLEVTPSNIFSTDNTGGTCPASA